MFHGLDAVSVNSVKALKDQRLFRLLVLVTLRYFTDFYRAMLCIRGTSHEPVSVSVSVCHKPVFY